MQINDLPAGGDCRDRCFPGNGCTQSSAPLTNTALTDITCKMIWKWHPTFSEDSRILSEIQWYKKTCTGFRFWDVQTCSCLFSEVKDFWKIYLRRSVLMLWWAPQINQCMGNTDYALCTQPCSVWIIYDYFVIHNLSLIAPTLCCIFKGPLKCFETRSVIRCWRNFNWNRKTVVQNNDISLHFNFSSNFTSNQMLSRI